MTHTTVNALRNIALSVLLLTGLALAEPATVKGLTLSQISAVPGQVVTGTVHLNAPAPAEGLQVELWSAYEAKTPTYVFVPAGQTSASFPIEVVQASEDGIKVAALQPAASAVGNLQVSAPVVSSR